MDEHGSAVLECYSVVWCGGVVLSWRVVLWCGVGGGMVCCGVLLWWCGVVWCVVVWEVLGRWGAHTDTMLINENVRRYAQGCYKGVITGVGT
eukprot:2663570-Rhodomonas_salina.2